MEQKIKQKKRGNALGISIFKLSAKFFGLRGAYGLLYIVCSYYAIFDRDAVVAALAYINRRFPEYGKLKSWYSVYLLFVSQGKQLIDRMAALNGYPYFKFDLKGQDVIDQIADSEKGCVLLTAHLGNWQLAISTLRNIGKKVSLVMRQEDNSALKNAIDVCGASDFIEIISPEGHLGGVVPIMNALKRGNIVSFMGDRAYGFEAMGINFLNDIAYFPYGAWNIAAAADVPVVSLLVSKTKYQHYEVNVENVFYPKYISRKDKKGQLKKWVQEYADLLNNFVDQYPYQCFLFYDVWKNDNIH